MNAYDPSLRRWNDSGLFLPTPTNVISISLESGASEDKVRVDPSATKSKRLSRFFQRVFQISNSQIPNSLPKSL
jgi:hypothetical protein